jgi:hypothetical protein
MEEQAWYDWAEERLADSSYLDKTLLSFYDETQYHHFNQRHRGQYTILHMLNDPQSDRVYVWVQKQKPRRPLKRKRTPLSKMVEYRREHEYPKTRAQRRKHGPA